MVSVTPIGVVKSCFPEKFGIPRQPSLVTESKATIEISAPFNRAEAFKGLETTSHIWVQFLFHAIDEQETRLSVRPPRLGGNEKLGVFATRAPFRPNRLGLSAVQLDAVTYDSGVQLHICGHDFLDGTPVLDIKPYVPYVDRIEQAVNQFASAPPALKTVDFSDQANHFLRGQNSDSENLNLARLIEQVLAQDPRPSYKGDDDQKTYALSLLDYTIKWRVQRTSVSTVIQVLSITLR